MIQKHRFYTDTVRECFRNTDYALKPFGNAPETRILHWYRAGMLQKHRFYAETARENAPARKKGTPTRGGGAFFL